MSADTERKILSIMTDVDCVDTAITALSEEDFTDVGNKTVFRTAKALWQDNKPVTLVTLAETIGKDNWGMISRLNSAIIASPAELNVLIENLKRRTKTRKLRMLADSVSANLADNANPDDVLKMIENTTFEIVMGDTQSAIIDGKERAKHMLQTLSQNMLTEGKGNGIKTSFGLLNDFQTGGFKTGCIYLLAGKTGQGKTAFAQNIQYDIAVVQKVPTLYCNTEMASEQIDNRLMVISAHDSTITHDAITMGKLTDEQVAHISGRVDAIANSAYYEFSRSDMSVDHITANVKRCKKLYETKVVVIDYLGRLDSDDEKLAEWQVFYRIVKRLKNLALAENVAVILLAQINEDEKLEGARKIQNEVDFYSYLLAMEDADIEKEQANGYNSNYWLIIPKNRMGRCGKIPFYFDKDRLKFWCGGLKTLQAQPTKAMDAAVSMFGKESKKRWA